MTKHKNGMWKNKNWLENQYTNLKKSSIEISELCNCSKPTILYWLEKFGINRRSDSECQIGKKLSEEHKRKIGKSSTGKNKGESNGNWKGDNVKYRGLHSWIQNNKPKPDKCEICGEKKKLELSNISGEYKRDVKDFQWICRKCHQVYDNICIKDKMGRFINVCS